MKATKQLSSEHESIKLMLEILEQISKKLKAKEKVNIRHLDVLIEFIIVFVDGCHHAKEENLLFPAMEKAGVPKEGGPIGMMLIEHDEERKYVKELVKNVEEYKKGINESARKIVGNIKEIVNILTDHIYKEDSILYMIANMHLTEEEQNKLVKEFEEIEIKKIGAGKHEEFQRMLNNLKNIYLK